MMEAQYPPLPVSNIAAKRCARTDPASDPSTATTTASGVTTTVDPPSAVTTTTVDPPAGVSCSTCTANQITWTTNEGIPTKFPSTFRVEDVDANGCAVITAICAAPTAGFFAFMQFNGAEGGPAENQQQGQTVEAALGCVNGQWYYDGVRAVNEVNCQEAPLP